jgi:hypothetical protein
VVDVARQSRLVRRSRLKARRVPELVDIEIPHRGFQNEGE